MSLWTNVDEAAGKPKHLNTADKAKTFGVSLAEAQTPDNIAKGLNTPGWVQHVTYTDAQGNTRNKSVVLAAFSTLTSDAADDSVVIDPVITIGTQPTNQTGADGDGISFSVAATANNGAPVTYMWQFLEPAGTWEDSTISNPGWATGQLTDTIAFTASALRDGYSFRCVVSTEGAADVTSNAVTFTLTV